MGDVAEHSNGYIPSVRQVLGTARHPYRAATSKPAQRVYLSGFILALAALFLLFLSNFSFIVFYYSYVPDVGATRVVHLQFGDGHPWGTTDVGAILISEQAYDISLSLHVPRTPANIATGNFMIDMALYSPGTPVLSPLELLKVSTSAGGVNSSTSALTRSRRTAILTHVSWLVDTANAIVNLPLFVLGWRKESEKMEVMMFEGVQFARGPKNIPNRIQVVIEAEEKMQFYEAVVKVRAQFRGLRWFMYNHRILSLIFFTSTFFTVAVVSAFLVYLAFGFYLDAPEQKEKEIKQESNSESIKDPSSTADLSDTSRRFPRRVGQAPLKYVGKDGAGSLEDDPEIKREEDIEASTGIAPLTAEADDEDEDEQGGSSSWRDSGIGTGRESDRRATQRRRKLSQDDLL